MTGGTWEPISDLPDDWQSLQRDDLNRIHNQWVEEKKILKDPEKITQLEERLSTEWAIETGIIERLYTVERGVTETLIELGLEALHQLHKPSGLTQDAVQLIRDQKTVLDFVFQFVKQNRELTDSYMKELHQLLTSHQETSEAVDQFGTRIQVELRKGAWKQLPNNPTLADGRIHEYCPPDFVQDEIDQLLVWHGEHARMGVNAEVEAAWLHHRFTEIHPFQDGNGRIARAIATMVFLRSDYLPLVIRDVEHRERYLLALESADRGDLAPLVNLFSDIQVSDLSKAIEFLRTLRGAGVAEIAASAAQRVKMRQTETEEEARELTDKLLKIAELRLQEVAAEMKLEFEKSDLHVDHLVGVNDETSERYWSRQIIEVAKRSGYWADLRRFRRWVRLRLRLPELGNFQTNLIISFHHRGTTAGLMVATAFVSTFAGEDADSDREYSDWDIIQASSNAFTYSGTLRDSERTFRIWLEDAIETGLDEWQASL